MGVIKMGVRLPQIYPNWISWTSEKTTNNNGQLTSRRRHGQSGTQEKKSTNNRQMTTDYSPKARSVVKKRMTTTTYTLLRLNYGEAGKKHEKNFRHGFTLINTAVKNRPRDRDREKKSIHGKHRRHGKRPATNNEQLTTDTSPEAMPTTHYQQPTTDNCSI